MTNVQINASQVVTPSQSSNPYHTQARYDDLTAFVKSTFPNHSVSIESLPGDASFRRYHRIYLEGIELSGENGTLDPSYILMDAPPQLESIESFVRIDTLMAEHINVPKLLSKDIEKGFLILQDFGSIEFAHLLADAKIKQDSGKIDDLYHWALDCLNDLQRIDVNFAKKSYDVPDYDAALLKREMSLFTEWFLPYVGADLDSESESTWLQFTQRLIEEIVKQPLVVVHRDFHSRNLMQDQYHKSELGVIDFQDAVIGSYTYDLVSLVRDAYVDWSEDQISNWINYFWQKSTKQSNQFDSQHTDSLAENSLDTVSFDNFITDVNLMGIQRHLKVLGIFVRLAERDGKSRYLTDIPKVWRDLMVEMQWLANNADAEIQAFIQPVYQWIQDDVKPKFEKKFSQ